jgi:hypothetical protein
LSQRQHGHLSKFTQSKLVEGHPVSLVGNVFTIGFTSKFEYNLKLVDNARNHTLLAVKLAELGYPGIKIKFIKAEVEQKIKKSPEFIRG